MHSRDAGEYGVLAGRSCIGVQGFEVSNSEAISTYLIRPAELMLVFEFGTEVEDAYQFCPQHTCSQTQHLQYGRRVSCVASGRRISCGQSMMSPRLGLSNQ